MSCSLVSGQPKVVLIGFQTKVFVEDPERAGFNSATLFIILELSLIVYPAESK